MLYKYITIILGTRKQGRSSKRAWQDFDPNYGAHTVTLGQLKATEI